MLHIATRISFCTGLAVALTLGGCNKHKLIPNTKIIDVPINREVLTLVETYRRAMERRDAARIYVLVHPSYNDSNGTPDSRDDFGYATLKKVLGERLERTSRIRYRIDYQRLEVKGREASLDVWIDATFVYEHPQGTPRYSRFTDYHRYVLLHTKLGWRFISGL